KIRGYRIELGEVEHAISHLPGIGAAVVTAPKQAGGQRTLAAYFTSENPLQVSQIRQQLLLKLPEYMVPAYFIRLEYFPLTSSGKVDRKALPAPDGAITEKVPYVAPRNEVEACLAAAYAYVLNKTTVSVKEHFFDAGGDSIKVITLINYLHQQQYDLKVSDVLKFPVLEDVAARINITGEMPHVVKTNLLPEYEAPAIISLSPNQRFYCHGSGYTNAHAELNVYLPDFDKDRFLRAYHQLTAAYDILRLRFIFNDNTFLQEVLPLEETKNTLTFIAAGVQRADVKPVHPDQPPFHLETGEIMRWRVVHGGEGGAWVNVAIHHIVTDNASNTRLIEAFMEMYKGGTAAPVKAAHYFNFIGIQQQYLESAAGKAQREYWQQRLEPTTEKRNDLPLQLIHHTQWIHGNRFTTMQAFCRQHHLLPSALVLSALYRFLRQSNEEKNRYTIGVVVNGADLYMPGFEMSNAIGQFMNMLPLQVALENEHDPSLPFLVQERYLEGRLNQQVPFRLIEEDFRERCGSELLLDGYLSYIDRTKETYTKDFEELAIEMPAGNEGIDTDLWCLCEEYHNSIVLKWYWKCYDAGSREDNSRLESIRKMNRLLDLLYTHTHNGIIMPEPLIDSPTNAE
ncbi:MULTISPECIES: condensation domain-containing protein, partial [unclassified Chitinophaga]|uniref:condensation domain-containing protein n=1 Tax=unclassified Chitinophaga TaxID=2619133 RepID=UPI00301027F9